MTDPRVEDNAESIKKIKQAILDLAANLDGLAWRASSEEERKAGIEIYKHVKETLGE